MQFGIESRFYAISSALCRQPATPPAMDHTIVIGQSGLIMRPNRARIKDKILEKLGYSLMQ